MALSFTNIVEKMPVGCHNEVFGVVDITLDGVYVAGGWTISPSDLDLTAIHALIPAGAVDGVTLEWDAANSKLKGVIAQGAANGTLTLTDDDAAATNGTALTVLPSDDGGAKFYSANTNNANSEFHVGASGAVFPVYDDTGAAGGTAVYFDEDGNSAGRLQFVSPDNIDAVVTGNDGSTIRIWDVDAAATNGVAVYFDDDATNEEDRLLFVSPTGANGTFAAVGEIGPDQLSGEVVRFFYMGSN